MDEIRCQSMEEFLIDIKKIDKEYKIYIWGISVYGDLLGRIFNREGIEWKGYYDNFYANGKDPVYSKPVLKNSEIDVSQKSVYIISIRKYEQVKYQLLQHGVDEKRIIVFDNINMFQSLEKMSGRQVSVEQIRSFKNRHKGEKCFVIGNGPSLCLEDLDKLHDSGMISFASNKIFRCYDKTEWRPEYYFCIDVFEVRETLSDIRILKYVSENSKYVISRIGANWEENGDKIQNLILYKPEFSEEKGEVKFSSDCSEKMYSGYTVTYAMLQMAVYMGFSEIYLLGMDHSYSLEEDEEKGVVKKEGVKDHSDILGNYSAFAYGHIPMMEMAYESAKKYADVHGIKIYNATRGGKLEVFERVSFNSLFEEKCDEI